MIDGEEEEEEAEEEEEEGDEEAATKDGEELLAEKFLFFSARVSKIESKSRKDEKRLSFCFSAIFPRRFERDGWRRRTDGFSTTTRRDRSAASYFLGNEENLESSI